MLLAKIEHALGQRRRGALATLTISFSFSPDSRQASISAALLVGSEEDDEVVEVEGTDVSLPMAESVSSSSCTQ